MINSLIIEIRAGVGGDEAALFANDLFVMYTKYAESRDWNIKILNSNTSDLGGIKSISFLLKGEGVNILSNEGGVHRVQRIPKTEKAGRIQTSAASVAILPVSKDSQIEINNGDLKIETCKSQGAGGQNVNKRETAVRVTHIPSGLVVESQSSRNQLQNKENAISLLKSKLLDEKNKKQQLELKGQRADQIKHADRSEKIRTYHFPQDRVTDHRIKKSWHDIEKIMSGKLDKLLRQVNEKIK